MTKLKEISRGRILVIDDQEATRYVFRRNLIYAGFEVEEAESGADGLARAMSGPDLIICDVNLPDILGYDVCRRLKSNPVTGSIPVLQISASFISDESKVQALEGGADSYLTQPVEPTVLIAQVNALLRLRRAESIANLSARQWQTTFDSLSDGVALLDADGIVVRTNHTFLDKLGLVSSETEGIHLTNTFLRTFGISFDQLLVRFEKTAAVELSYENRWFRMRYNLIESAPGEHNGSILLLTETTDQKKLQETLRFNERLAATGRLAHVIAHEINNPLEAMSNLLYLAEKSATKDDDTRSYVEQAAKELDRISQITRQVLAYHRETTVPIVTPADEILEGVLAIFRAHIMANKVTLDARLKSSTKVFVLPGELRQVFSNLLINALDAMGKDGGILRVRCFNTIDLQSQRKGIRFIFSDSGTGIQESLVTRIFEAFFTTKGLKGSGVGLSKFPRLAKLSSSDELQRLISKSLPGLGLRHQPSPPASVPINLSCQYFSLSASGPLWENILRARSLSVFVPGEIAEVHMELLTVLS